MSFDPIIALNHHVSLLTLLKAAKEEYAKARGITKYAARHTGAMIFAELEKSKTSMKAHQMWVAEESVGERRYRYGFRRERGEHEISQEDLKLHMRAILGDISRELMQLQQNPGERR